MAQFMASYRLGDDLFDNSFSIDSPAGEFLGECGVGISETIGVGDPKKVTAFEVWLFDKNDIQTVTKVVMSAHAFNDVAIRQRLEAKGEPVLAEPGSADCAGNRNPAPGSTRGGYDLRRGRTARAELLRWSGSRTGRLAEVDSLTDHNKRAAVISAAALLL